MPKLRWEGCVRSVFELRRISTNAAFVGFFSARDRRARRACHKASKRGSAAHRYLGQLFRIGLVSVSTRTVLTLSRHRPATRACSAARSDGGIEPDWLRVGTDITHQGPFNAAFSLSGSVIPEPSTWAMMLLGFAGLGFAGYRHARKTGPASA
jgi:hypothetical protein